ncbi:Hypothetical protein PHPALM_10086 [Phytophthora palmivora]|uniref:Uncharacterized protein n=1 Tax=Phytophthora palmivora TaxID=4796 RepID=A0A2P4Y5L5_9STRA|nr:Hypothetical protein PHPALM_10086 [Phytophthora palmivora]
MAKGIQIAFKCAKEMMGLVKALSKYVRTVEVSDPASDEKLLTMLYQTDNVVFDIPITIMSCLGIKVSDEFKLSDRILNTGELALKEILANGAAIVSSWSAFTRFMKNITLGESINSLSKTEITSLQSALESNSTCGYDMKRLLDRTWMTVAELRRQNPSISEDNIRVAMSKSNLALHDIPTVTNNCMEELIAESDEAKAYTTRETLRKGLGGIIDDLISSGTSGNGTLLTAGQYAYKIADKVATFYAVWERKNIGGVMSEFFQTICGPTQFIGDIDDGTVKEALGFKTVKAAFNNSEGNWTKVGDGSVTITFKSADTEDVSVNIKSGGDKIAEVKVAAGETVTWKSNITTLGGKTLYLDRWRPGFLGLPGTGGGSLVLVGDAFKGSTDNWTKSSDGTVTITFRSTDTEDVTVNIKSGGSKFAKVEVPAGETVSWSSNVVALGGKMLYLDRWRPGFLGLPGTGGGSLLLWISRSTQCGSLQLTAMLNAS